MPATVRSLRVLDGAHRNGHPTRDGDQTLWEGKVIDGEQCEPVLFVVHRCDGFIPKAVVKRHVDQLGLSLDELRALAHRPAPDRCPQIALSTEPGEE